MSIDKRLLQPLLGFTPVLTTMAGTSLTVANWQAAQVKSASFHLPDLLVKPGFSCLKALPSLGQYVDWYAPLVLNAASLRVSSQGECGLKSSYDGQRLNYPLKDILMLMGNLKPTIALLPEGHSVHLQSWWDAWPLGTMPFISWKDVLFLPQDMPAYGVYFLYDEGDSSEGILSQVAGYRATPRYVAGALDVDVMQVLLNEGVNFIESDYPAKAACLGRVYGDGQLLSLQEEHVASQHQVIDAHCTCPTCKSSFTRAYLHHLFTQTPLLCRRFLVQHNVYYCQSILGGYRAAIDSNA